MMKLLLAAFAALSLFASSAVASKNAGKCDLTGMYDIIETASYDEFGIPATDTAKTSFICFDDEDEFWEFECILFDDCGGRKLELAPSNHRSLEHDLEQICWFEAMGFPAIAEGTAVHNYGIAGVFKESIEFPNGDKKLCAFELLEGEGPFTYGLQIRKGVLAMKTEIDTLFPYFAHKTTTK